MWSLGYGLKDQETVARFLTVSERFTAGKVLDWLFDPAIYLANGYRQKTHFPRAKWPGCQNHQSLPSSGEFGNERI
jgi:hypothetical protein